MVLSTAVFETKFTESFTEKIAGEKDAGKRRLREEALVVFTEKGFS